MSTAISSPRPNSLKAWFMFTTAPRTLSTVLRSVLVLARSLLMRAPTVCSASVLVAT